MPLCVLCKFFYEAYILPAMCVNNFWQSCKKEGSRAHDRGSLKGMEKGSIWWKVLHEEPKNNESDAEGPLQRAPAGRGGTSPAR